MTGNRPSSTWDEEVDLRRWVAALIRGRLIILTFFLTALAVAAIFNFLLMPPNYVASGTISLPMTDGTDQLGLTLPDYEEFAVSGSTMRKLKEELGSPLSAQQLRSYFQFQLAPATHSLGFTTTASTPAEALSLAKLYFEVFSEELESQLEVRFSAQKERANQRAEHLLGEWLEAEAQLQAFDLETPMNVLEPRLVALESELTKSATDLRELTRFTIPDHESQLASLQDSLTRPSPVLSGAPGTSAIPEVRISGESSLENSAAADFTHLQLEQKMNQSRLVSLEKELVSQESRLRQLRLVVLRTAEAKVESLEEILALIPTTLGTAPIDFTKDDTNVDSNNSPQLNPLYLRYSQELEDSRIQLAANREEAEALAEGISVLQKESEILRQDLVIGQELIDQLEGDQSVEQQMEGVQRRLSTIQREADSLAITNPVLRQEVKEFRQEVLSARSTRSRLAFTEANAKLHYESARRDLNNLLALDSQSSLSTNVIAVREPPRSVDSVAPQRTRNMILAAILGLFLGATLVLFREMYRGQPAAAGVSPREDSPEGAEIQL
ncbi:MAG: Wzz/FepE/Etk N-terminal domain-containing protein [Dehalococcoidia bacterium]